MEKSDELRPPAAERYVHDWRRRSAESLAAGSLSDAATETESSSP